MAAATHSSCCHSVLTQPGRYHYCPLLGTRKLDTGLGRVAWQSVSWVPQQMGTTPKTQLGVAGQVQGSLDTGWLRVDGRVAPLVGCAQIGSHG